MKFLNFSMIKFLVLILIFKFLAIEDLRGHPLSAKDLFDLDDNGIKIMRFSTITASNLVYDIEDMVKIELGNKLMASPKNKNLNQKQLEDLLNDSLKLNLDPQIQTIIEQNLLNTLNDNLENYWNHVHLFSCGLESKIVRICDGNTTNPIDWGRKKIKKRHYGLIAVKDPLDNNKGKILISFQGSPGSPANAPQAWTANISSEWINLENFYPEENELKYARCFFSNGYKNANVKFKSPNHYVMTKHQINPNPGVIIGKFYMNKHSQEHYMIKNDEALEVPDDTLEKAHIHRGFFQTTLSSQQEIFELLRNEYADLLSDHETDYILTGHSLGAASTTVFAAPLYAFLKESNGNQNPSLNIINYGSPRVFNTTAGRLFNEQIGVSHILRVINNNDSWNLYKKSDAITWIPKFPPSSYWKHAKTLWLGLLFEDDYMHVGTLHSLYNIPKYGIDLHLAKTYLEYSMK